MAERVILEAGKTFSEFSLLTNFTKKSCTLQDISLESELGGMKLGLPFMSAAMTSVTGYEMALSLGKEGGIGILPARLSINEQVEIIEKVKNLENLLLVGIPTRGIELTEVLEKELFFKTGLRVRKGTIDPTFYRDDQNRVGTRLIKATDIPTPIEKQEILLVDDVIYTGRTIRAAMDALYSWGRPQRVMLLVMVDRGHRELPIQPDFCGKKVPTSKIESISLRLKSVDNEEGVFLE